MRMPAWFVIGVALISAATAAGCRGDAKECDLACRNGYTLSFWAKQDPIIEAAPSAQRALLRRQTQVKLEAELDRGMDLCTSQCVAANDGDRAKCMIKATTGKEFQACMPPE